MVSWVREDRKLETAGCETSRGGGGGGGESCHLFQTSPPPTSQLYAVSRHQFVSKLGSSLIVIKAAACQVGRGRPNLFRWVFILIFTLSLSSSGPGENSLWAAELIFLLQPAAAAPGDGVGFPAASVSGIRRRGMKVWVTMGQVRSGQSSLGGINMTRSRPCSGMKWV